MTRKKWTPKSEVDETLLQFREKRKWQIALRRYILEKQKCLSYAPYFGLDNTKFREWIELQFDIDQQWENFSSAWYLDHVVPVAYFDFTNENDLRLCWNFINIRVSRTDKSGVNSQNVNALAAKHYFETLYQKTNHPLCASMIDKIEQIEAEQTSDHKALESFLVQNKHYLAAAQHFTAEDFNRLNTGTELNVLLSEKEFLKKFSG